MEKLGIYRESYKLVSLIYKCQNEMPRKDRFSIGARMIDSGLDMLDHITLAYLTKVKMDRLKSLGDFFKSFTRLQTYLRICLDFTLLSLDTLARMHPIVENISKQYNGWKNSTSRMRP